MRQVILGSRLFKDDRKINKASSLSHRCPIPVLAEPRCLLSTAVETGDG